MSLLKATNWIEIAEQKESGGTAETSCLAIADRYIKIAELKSQEYCAETIKKGMIEIAKNLYRIG